MIRVTIWNEFWHERNEDEVKQIYPDGIHEHLKKVLQEDDFEIKTAYLDKDDEHGLSEEVLENTDVLMWWGHCQHHEVKDEIVQRVYDRVLFGGMGLIAMHSAHDSKIFKKLMGSPCSLHWRAWNEKARVWTVAPNHPIAKGIPLQFDLDAEEMYGEYFQIPQPDDIVFISWFEGGNVFRGGVTFTRGAGKIFYFHPGHEFCPSFHNKNVIQIHKNAIRWAAPVEHKQFDGNHFKSPLESGVENKDNFVNLEVLKKYQEEK